MHSTRRESAPQTILRAPIQLFAGGLSFGAGPAVLLGLVFVIGMALTLAGPRRRATRR